MAVNARDGSTRRVAQTPYRFSKSESGLSSNAVAPYRGEHNSEVLNDWLGVSRHEVNALLEAGVLLEENPPEERTDGQT